MMKKYIYKYYSKEEFILDLLRHKRLYFCKPSEFNDPFDCQPPISIQHCNCKDEEVWRKFIYYFCHTQYCNRPKDEIKRIAKEAFRAGFHKNPEQLARVDKHLKEVGPLVRVCCFSEDKENTMLWAHYANNHQGIVFQFDTKKLRDISGKIRVYNVEYKEAIDLKTFADALENKIETDDHIDIIKIFFATKSENWVKEKEIRFFSNANQSYVEIPEVAISEIIFGSKSSKWLIQHVLDEIKQWKHQPKLCQANIEKSTAHKLCIDEFHLPDKDKHET